MTTHDPIAELSASPIRRLFAYGVMFALGALLILLAFAQPSNFGVQAFLVLLGAGALVVAERLRRSTQLGLVLTEVDLRDTSGRVLARLDDIASIDRGVFAFKPSHGFLLRLKEPQARVWAPGLWWRVSSRVGVGGVTPSGAAKFMAEQIALRLDR